MNSSRREEDTRSNSFHKISVEGRKRQEKTDCVSSKNQRIPAKVTKPKQKKTTRLFSTPTKEGEGNKGRKKGGSITNLHGDITSVPKGLDDPTPDPVFCQGRPGALQAVQELLACGEGHAVDAFLVDAAGHGVGYPRVCGGCWEAHETVYLYFLLVVVVGTLAWKINKEERGRRGLCYLSRRGFLWSSVNVRRTSTIMAP
jgi:hypothetical protein